MSARLTERQSVVLLTLGLRYPGRLSTNELRDLAARAGLSDDDFPELDSPLSNPQIVTTARQLVRKGLATEEGYLNTMRHWKLTPEGRARVDALRGVVEQGEI